MNSIRFVSSTIHGLLDYAAAGGLIIFPVLLGFDGLTLWLSVAGGVGLIGYSLITDYAFSVAPVISFKTHLALDLTAGAVFIAAPFVFGWTGLVMGYYFAMASGVSAAVVFTGPESATDGSSTVSVGA